MDAPQAEAIVQQIRLQRRPFATLSDAIEREREALGLPAEASVWYVSFERGPSSSGPQEQGTFHWVAGLGADTVSRILNAESEIRGTIGKLFERTGKGTVEQHARAEADKTDPTAFVSSVLSLIYSFNVPLEFIEGRVHGKRSPAIHLIEIHPLEVDRGHGLPLMRFADGEFITQSDQPPDDEVRALIDLLDKISPRAVPRWVVCVPVLGDYHADARGEETSWESVRGYFSIGYPRRAAAEAVTEQLHKAQHHARKQLNGRLSNALHEGMRNYLLESYPSRSVELEDPVSFWLRAIRSLEPWEPLPYCDVRTDKPYTECVGGVCVPVGQLVELRKSFSGGKLLPDEEIERFARNYSSHCIHLNSSHRPYLESSVYTANSLLNDILLKRQALVEEEKARRLARSAAVSAVMSRNMSHNLGSHVLARASDRGQATPSVPESPYSERLALADEQLAAAQQLLAYLRTRMDFLADVATGVPTALTPKRLHDVLDPFDWETLLKRYISGTDLETIVVSPVDTVNRRAVTSPLVGIANDTLGDHAFYVILENVIRNTCKHAVIPNGGLNIFVRVGEANRAATEAPPMISVTVFDGVSREYEAAVDLVAERNKDIDSSILEGERLRSKAWGVLEMKIAAGYLRGRDPADIDDTSLDPPLLTACVETYEGGNHLGYRFFLPAYQLAKVVCFSAGSSDNLAPLAAGFSKIGVDIKMVLDQPITAVLDTPTAHDFLVLVDPPLEALASLEDNKSRLPMRIGIVSSSQTNRSGGMPLTGFLECLSNATRLLPSHEPAALAEIASHLWEQWSTHRFGGSLPDIYLATCSRSAHKHERLCDKGVASPIPDGAYVLDSHGECRAVSPQQRWAYWEYYGTQGLLSGALRHRSSGDGRCDQLRSQLLEAARLRVAIVDERVQARANAAHPRISNLKLHETLGVLGISIPPANINLSAQHFDERLKYEITKWIDEQLGGQPPADVLVIHLGIIEKLTTTALKSIQDWIGALQVRHELTESSCRDVIVTSGRGTPPNLPPDVRFVHLSPLLRYLFEDSSKLHFTRLIASSRALRPGHRVQLCLPPH